MPYVEYDEVEAVCPECGMTFRSEDTLQSHVEEVHAAGHSATPADRPVRGPALSCPTCFETFTSPAARDRHIRFAHSR